MENVKHAQITKFQTILEKAVEDQAVHRLSTKMDLVDNVKTIIITMKERRNASQEFVIIDQELQEVANVKPAQHSSM